MAFEKFNYLKLEMTTQNYILDNHWTLDIHGQSIYTCPYPQLVMDTQVSLFRYPTPQETNSSETIVYPLVEGAKKFCKCGCGKEVKNIYINGHANKGKKFPKEWCEKISSSRKGIIFSPEHKFNLSQTRKLKIRLGLIPKTNKGCFTKENHSRYWLGRKKSKEHLKNLSISNMGRKAWNKGIPLSIETKKKLSESIKKALQGKISPSKRYDVRLKISKSNKGKKHKEETKIKISAIQQGIPIEEWKIFKTSETERIRKDLKSVIWREYIFKRDNFTCQECLDRNGNGHSVNLQAHHIKPFSKYPELRFDINNGITLCIKCHNKTKQKEEQFIDYFLKKVIL